MPPKKARKPKKPVQQKQKQKQSQRVVVNVNQARPAKRARPRARQVQQPQQVVYQPLITMTGSVPVPQPNYNPIQSTAGFPTPPPTPSLGTPTNLSAPVDVPVFADESVKVIGDEPMTAPTPAPVSKPVDIIVPIRPYIPEDRPIVVMPKPAPPPPASIISTKPPLTIDKSDSSSGKFILPPPPVRSEMKPDDSKSVSTLLSELSRDTGINSKSVADFLFKKKKPDRPTPVPPVDRERPPARVSGSQVSVSSGSSGEGMGIIPLESDGSMSYSRIYPKGSDLSSDSDSAFEAVRDAERKNREIARRYKPDGGFSMPSDNDSIKSGRIIVGDAPPIVLSDMSVVSSGSSGKTKSNPYDPFAQSDSSVGGKTVSDTDISMKVKKPVKKRPVERPVSSDSELSDTGANIIPNDAPAGRRLPPISETKAVKGKSPYSSLNAVEITRLAEKQGIPVKKKGSKGQDVRVPAKELLPLLK